MRSSILIFIDFDHSGMIDGSYMDPFLIVIWSLSRDLFDQRDVKFI